MKQIIITIIFIIIIIFVVTMIILMRLFGKRGGLTAGDLDRKQWVDLVGGGAFLITILKGEVRPYYWLKVFIGRLQSQQAIFTKKAQCGSKTCQSVQNKNQMASDPLWESTDFVLQAAVARDVLEFTP